MFNYRSGTNRILVILAAFLVLLAVAATTAQPARAAEGISVPVKVSYEGKNLPSETFTVEMSGGNLEAPLTKSAELSMSTRNAELSFDIGELPLGIHEFTIKEIQGSIEDLSYDSREYSYFIMVNDDGSIEQRAVNKEDTTDKPDTVAFVNTYKSSDPDEVLGDPPIKIRKVITGQVPEKASEFRFIMSDAGNTAGLDNNPMPEGYEDGVVEVSITGEGEVEIGNIRFTEEGVYSYSISEKDTKVEGYTYDDAVYDVTYTVVRNASTGRLECERKVYKNKTDPITSGYCEFDNIYKAGSMDIIKRGVKTGDPTVMLPLTMLVIACILAITVIADRRRREDRFGQRR